MASSSSEAAAITRLVLVDSTGYGMLGDRPDKNPGAVVVEGNIAYVISPGSSLHSAGVHRGQHSLARMVAEHKNVELDGFFASTSSDPPLKFCCIRAEDSIGREVSKKMKSKYKYVNLLRYRGDMSVPQTRRSIASYSAEFPELYGTDDPLHFKREIAAEVFRRIIADGLADMCLDPSERAVLVCAGWNAEPNKVSSMCEAFCLRHLLECKGVGDIVHWSMLHSMLEYNWCTDGLMKNLLIPRLGCVLRSRRHIYSNLTSV